MALDDPHPLSADDLAHCHALLAHEAGEVFAGAAGGEDAEAVEEAVAARGVVQVPAIVMKFRHVRLPGFHRCTW